MNYDPVIARAYLIATGRATTFQTYAAALRSRIEATPAGAFVPVAAMLDEVFVLRHGTVPANA
jgi:hypothetical protein